MELEIKGEASRGKYGLVCVVNEDGTFNREFKITSEEYAALALPGAGAPPGVIKDEWESGLAIAYGKDFEVGDAEEQPDGTMLIKYDEKIENGRIVESFTQLEPNEWSGDLPNITIPSVVSDDGQIISADNGLLTIEGDP